MDIPRNISTSAFLVNESRARNITLSRDIYARLWVTQETRNIWEDFTRKVYPHDALELGIRNRFFLEQLNRQIHRCPETVFVNIGAGFTSYPFLTDRKCTSIEVDYPHIVDFKAKRIRQWQQEGRMPAIPIEFIGVDLNCEKDLDQLLQSLRQTLGTRPSLILMEGITYYLKPDRFYKIIQGLRDLQSKGSILTFDFWEEKTAAHAGCIRFKKYLSDELGHKKNYNHMAVNEVRALAGYHLATLTDVQAQETQFCGSNLLSPREEVIFDTYAVLEKE